jgi:hypothetical protein
MRRKTHQEYVSEVAIVNPNIEVVGQYINGHTAILHKCKLDGHEWMAMPSNILRGKGCPKCKALKLHNLKVKTHEQYVNEVYNINPNILADIKSNFNIRSRDQQILINQENGFLKLGNGDSEIVIAKDDSIFNISSENAIEIDVEDDGIGFDIYDVEQKSKEDFLHGFGLSTMKERARLLSGTFSIDTKPGYGTKIHVCVPVNYTVRKEESNELTDKNCHCR